MSTESETLAVDRRRDSSSPTKTMSPAVFVWPVVVLSVLVVGTVLGLTWIQPEKDHTAIITIIVGVLGPVVTGLLAAAVGQLGKQVDGRLNQLLAMTARTHAAEGELAGQQKILEQIPAVVVPAATSPIPVNGGFVHSRAGDKTDPTP